MCTMDKVIIFCIYQRITFQLPPIKENSKHDYLTDSTYQSQEISFQDEKFYYRTVSRDYGAVRRSIDSLNFGQHYTTISARTLDIIIRHSSNHMPKRSAEIMVQCQPKLITNLLRQWQSHPSPFFYTTSNRRAPHPYLLTNKSQRPHLQDILVNRLYYPRTY